MSNERRAPCDTDIDNTALIMTTALALSIVHVHEKYSPFELHSPVGGRVGGDSNEKPLVSCCLLFSVAEIASICL